MAHDVFVSHSSKDKVIADAVCAALEQAGIRCWIAPRDIRPGASWGKAIVEAIEQSRVMVIVFSAEANASKQVMREVERGVQKNVVVVPFRVEDVQPSGDMEYFLSATHWLDAMKPSLESGIRKLVTTVQQVLGREGEPVPEVPMPVCPEKPGPGAVVAARVSKLNVKLLAACAGGLLLAALIIGLVVHSCGREDAWDPDGSLGAPEEMASRLEKPKNRAARHTRVKAEGEPLLLELGNDVRMKLVAVPEGTFLMGAAGHADSAVHEVRISRGFWISEHEVTQQQYEAVMGRNPSHFKGTRRPVDSVSWYDADAFCKTLAFKVGYAVRLPTEAEWEYACRAGTEGPFNCGGVLDLTMANFDGEDAGGERGGVEALDETSEVGAYAPNAWGLYDMHGNVWEWCGDWYDADYYSRRVNADPDGPKNGEEKVLRGGAWGSDAEACSSGKRSRSAPELKKGINLALYNATRLREDPAAQPSQLGFRVVAVAKGL